MTARAEETEYKGNPTITIFTGHAYKGEEESISFGLRKAQAVDDCIDAIRARHGRPIAEQTKRDRLERQADRILDEDCPF